MKRLRVLVLMHAHLVPPEGAEQLPAKAQWLFKMELEVMRTLRQLGHEARALGVQEELLPIRQQVAEWRPHVVFNVLTHFHDVATYDAHVVSFLELLKQPYTGCNPRGIVLAGDKALSKKILAWHRIRCPQFAAYALGCRAIRLPARMTFPVIVKSSVEHGSTGIAQASVVHDGKGLVERVEFVHRTLSTPAIAEQFIEGKELTVSVLGNDRLQVFPPWELWFENLPDRAEAIQTSRVKWDDDYAARIGTRTGPARGLTKEQEQEIDRIARRTYRALDLSGFARIDLRMDREGRLYVIEANCNPDLTPGEDFPESAQAAGLDYPALLQKVLTLGIGYQSAWKVE